MLIFDNKIEAHNEKNDDGYDDDAYKEDVRHYSFSQVMSPRPPPLVNNSVE